MNTKTILLGMILITEYVCAASLTNNIQGVGPEKNPLKPYFCIQNEDGQVTYALAPGMTVSNANQYSNNRTYVGGSLRFGGCEQSDTYLGYMGFRAAGDWGYIDYDLRTYSPPKGVHIAYTNPTIDSNGVIGGKISYTPIEANFQLSAKPQQNSHWNFVGINLSGLEFGKTIEPIVIPNLSAADSGTHTSDLDEVQSFIRMGMNTVRVPISWGFIQLDGPGKGELNLEYYDAYVKPLLQTLSKAQVHTIVDLHAYMRYSEFGKAFSGCGENGACPDGIKILDPLAYQDVWTKIYTLLKNDPNIDMNYIMLDLMNEPVDVDDDAVFTIQAKVINALRTQGFNGYILVEGNSWTGLHSWTTEHWKSKDGKKSFTNATLFTRENFAKAGITDLSKIVINVHQYFDYNFSGTSTHCEPNLNSTGANGYNLDAFVEYLRKNKLQAMVTEFGAGKDQFTCIPALTNFMDYLKENSAKKHGYGFIGWTTWSTGHGWGDYNLRVTPTSYQAQVLQNYLN